MQLIDVANFWASMKEIFGASWTYGSKPSATWEKQLLKLSVDQLNLGKKTIFELALDFPPNLMRFIDYCRNGKPFDPKRDVVRPLGEEMPSMNMHGSNQKLLGYTPERGRHSIDAIYARKLPRKEKGNPAEHDFRNWSREECREYLREVFDFKLADYAEAS